MGRTIFDAMEITVTPEQHAWLEPKVAAGEFGTVEEAAAAAITDSMAGEIDDMAWAMPHVDEARAAIARGKILTLEEHRADTDAPLAKPSA
jgi:antitoxin ParD1/3/4